MAGQGPLVLIILDGWGLRGEKEGNAIALAHKPNMDGFLSRYPHTVLGTSGTAVGLPQGQMGNSEVGHLNIGAGRVVYQELTRISKAIEDGDFFNNQVLLQVTEQVRQNQSALHLMGLLSDGGVHSHIEHLYALLQMARDQGLRQVYVHCFLDGRDVPPANAGDYITALEQKMAQIKCGKIATVMGRYYAMDRDQRWERNEKAYLAMVEGEGIGVSSGMAAVEQAYQRGETDEFVLPSVVQNNKGQPVARVNPGDGVIFYNFRPDRARQITRAFVDQDFTGFRRPQGRPGVDFVCMTQYDKTIAAPVAYKPQALKDTLGEVLSKHGMKQLRLAETEKYAHVTFFFNGGVEVPNPGEDRILVPSPKVATYDLHPAMSALEVTDILVQRVKDKRDDVVIMNYANPDMVGHTGKLNAAIEAVEAVDRCLGRAVAAILEAGGTAMITADHGNAEIMLDQEGKPYTAHTTNPVPLILISPQQQDAKAKLRAGTLQDIAPTMLQLLGLKQPGAMTGRSLLEM